jgi:hypothetical protein
VTLQRHFRNSLLLPLFFSTAIGLIAVSNQTLWIDEGLSASKAMAATWNTAWKLLLEESNTNMHMLLYMASLWAWEKIAGHSEWALRAMNIPFFVAGVLALWVAATPRMRVPLLLATCFSPFLWFYLDEARPYCMLFAFSSFATGLLIYWQKYKIQKDFPLGVWSLGLALSLSALSWTHIVGLVFQVGVCAFIFFNVGFQNVFRMAKKCFPAITFLGVCDAALLVYHAWTKTLGVEANALGKTTVVNLLFWVYEFFGFAGLGPNRNNLRLDPVGTLFEHAIPLALLGFFWLVFAVYAIKKNLFKKGNPSFSLVLCLVLTPLIILYFLGVFEGTRLLPRFATPSFAALAYSIASLVPAVWNINRYSQVAVIALLVLLVASCFALRFGAEHGKDDYRSAASIALANADSEKTILWAADKDTGSYYGLDFEAITSGGVKKFALWKGDLINASQLPDLIFLSKRDIYDPTGFLSRMAADFGYVEHDAPSTFVILSRNQNIKP